MSAHLRSVDSHEHLVTTSYRFTPPSTSCRAYQLSNIDFIQVHSYWDDVIAKFPDQVNMLWDFGKPVLIAEFGLHVSPNYFAADPAGLHVHDGLWAGIFSGSAGGGMTWWWERYVQPRDLYFHFTGISRFLKDESFEGAKPWPSSIKEAGPASFSFALKTKSKLFAWVGSPRHITLEGSGNDARVKSYRCAGGGPLELRLPGNFKGRFNMETYDTFDGVVLKREVIEGTEASLVIAVPEFRHDIAFKCSAAERMPPAPPPPPPTPIHDHFGGMAGK
jgi:hypothetical protein